MTISTFNEHNDNVHGKGHVLFDMSRMQVWLSIIGLLGGFAISAATGVLATARLVVPPLAIATLRPDLDRLALADAKLEAKITTVQGDVYARESENTTVLRQQMADLQGQLRESSRVTNELLLKLAGKWGR
jgi:hypothetical protein